MPGATVLNGDSNSDKSRKISQNQSGMKQALTPEMVDLALAELRFQTAVKMEVVQAMMDGTTLGAAQVQDKRIELLEVGPSTNPWEEILLFSVVLILEGTVGGHIVGLTTKVFLGNLAANTIKAIGFRKNQAALSKKLADLLTNQKLLSLHAGNFESIVKPLQKTVDSLKKDLRNLERQEILEVKYAFSQLTTNVNITALAVLKSANAVKHDVPGTVTPLTSSDSAGVSVQAAAMAKASQLRLAVVAVHEAFEAKIKDSKTTIDDVIRILQDYRSNVVFDLSSIRDAYQSATEAMIWAQLLLDEIEKEIIRNRREIINKALADGYGITKTPGYIFTREEHKPMKIRNEKYRDYLRVRFGKQVEQWARATNAWVGDWNGGFRRPTWGASVPKQQREKQLDDLVVAYLTEVADSITPDKLELRQD